MQKPVYFILGLVVVGLVGIYLGASKQPVAKEAYKADQPGWQIGKVADGLGPITRLQLTPDGQVMFVAAVDGTVRALRRQNDRQFELQSEPVYKIDHGFAAGVENGLTGLIVSAEYAQNRNIFLLYAQNTNSGEGESRILKLRVDDRNGKIIAANPQIIFRGNVKVAGAHQIQGGQSLIIEGKPHLLFGIGEAYHAEYASDLTKEAGKILLLQETGANPLGLRPYPNYPRVQAMGIRNAYGLAIDSADQSVVITDNGPDSNDRILDGDILNGAKQFDFNWHGDAATLLQPMENGVVNAGLVAESWDPTVAPTEIKLLKDREFVFNIFSTVHHPTAQVMRGWFGQDGKFRTQSLASHREGQEKGKLLGLAASSTGTIYFGDMLSGTIYYLVQK